MLPYLLIMIITTASRPTTIQLPMPDQQTCYSIEQNIVQQVGSNGGGILSKGCYNIPGGGNH